MRYWPLLLVVGCTTVTTVPPAPAPAPPVEAPPAPPPALGMNDVSVLVPLPTSLSAPGYLKARSAGSRGELLPKAVYDEIPPFPVKPPQGLDYGRMRTVAIRFDGCFVKPSGCEGQIRLVMQPISDKGDALDSALHLFYRLTDTELAEVVTALRTLRTLAPEVADAPLAVHGALVAQGMDGAYGQGLRELVLQYAGEQNLVRMTFFLRAPPANEVWFFGGFERKNGALTALDIMGVGQGNQRVMLDPTTDGYVFDVLPVETKPEDTNVLLSTAKVAAATEAEVKTALEALARIENPQRYTPDQLPCAGCHVATAIADRGRAKLGAASVQDAFTSARDLTVTGDAAKTPGSLRGFGWFGKSPMIGRRVVNETAHVLDDLESRFPVTP